MGSISYCIQYLARLAVGQKSNTYCGDSPKKSLTLTDLLTDQALGPRVCLPVVCLHAHTRLKLMTRPVSCVLNHLLRLPLACSYS